jgi:hypothetical protein
MHKYCKPATARGDKRSVYLPISVNVAVILGMVQYVTLFNTTVRKIDYSETLFHQSISLPPPQKKT